MTFDSIKYLQDDVGSHSRWPPEQDPSDLPSDLSVSAQSRDKLAFGEDLSIPVTGASLYKFKSNIRHRFDSSRSVDDDKDVIITGKRTRLDSTSTDQDPHYDDLGKISYIYFESSILAHYHCSHEAMIVMLTCFYRVTEGLFESAIRIKSCETQIWTRN